MSALPTGDSGYQLDDGEGRVLKMHPKYWVSNESDILEVETSKQWVVCF